MITRPDGSLLNTCTSDAIVQMLRHLKRAYWPFAWDSSQGLAEDSRGLGIGGGFEGAAKVGCSVLACDFRTLHEITCQICVKEGGKYRVSGCCVSVYVGVGWCCDCE